MAHVEQRNSAALAMELAGGDRQDAMLLQALFGHPGVSISVIETQTPSKPIIPEGRHHKGYPEE